MSIDGLKGAIAQAKLLTEVATAIDTSQFGPKTAIRKLVDFVEYALDAVFDATKTANHTDDNMVIGLDELLGAEFKDDNVMFTTQTYRGRDDVLGATLGKNMTIFQCNGMSHDALLMTKHLVNALAHEFYHLLQEKYGIEASVHAGAKYVNPRGKNRTSYLTNAEEVQARVLPYIAQYVRDKKSKADSRSDFIQDIWTLIKRDDPEFFHIVLATPLEAEIERIVGEAYESAVEELNGDEVEETSSVASDLEAALIEFRDNPPVAWSDLMQLAYAGGKTKRFNLDNGISYALQTDRDGVYFCDFKSADKGQGHARAALNDLLVAADNVGVTLTLDAIAGAGGMRQSALEAFYRRMGFANVGGSNRMLRKPKETAAVEEAGGLKIVKSVVNEGVTKTLREAPAAAFKPGLNHSSMSGAVWYAAKLARKKGNEYTLYCYRGNSYMNRVYRVTYKRSEALDAINNDGTQMIEVSPDLTVTEHTLERPVLTAPAKRALKMRPEKPETAATTRYFIRFGEMPKGGRSKLWTAPNAYHNGNVGKSLPGMSVYEVKKRGKKWVLDTDNINSGSGHASLAELFYRHAVDQSLPIFLLSGTPVRWMDLDEKDQVEFEDYWLGEGKRYAKYDLMGTDGEPMLREHKVIGKVPVKDLVCETIDFPKDYQEYLDGTIEKASLGVLYHYTDAGAVLSMLTKGKIRLTSVERVGGTETKVQGNKKAFFLSLTRSKVGGYHERTGGANYSVLIEFDYDALSHNSKIKPVDYWGPEFRKAQSNMNEMEERLFSDEQWLPLKPSTIKSLHFMVKEYDDRMAFRLRRALIAAKSKKILCFVYGNKVDWMAMRPDRALTMEQLKPFISGQETFPYQGQRTNFLANYYEAYMKPLGQKLSKRADDVRYKVLYYPEDAQRALEADLHNDQKSDYVGKLMKVIQKEGGTKGFLQFLRDKYKPKEESSLGISYRLVALQEHATLEPEERQLYADMTVALNKDASANITALDLYEWMVFSNLPEKGMDYGPVKAAIETVLGPVRYLRGEKSSNTFLLLQWHYATEKQRRDWMMDDPQGSWGRAKYDYEVTPPVGDVTYNTTDQLIRLDQGDGITTASVETAFTAGEMIEVEAEDGKWYPAKVKSIRGEKVTFYYDGQPRPSSTWVEFVRPSKAKPKRMKAATPAAKQTRRGKKLAKVEDFEGKLSRFEDASLEKVAESWNKLFNMPPEDWKQAIWGDAAPKDMETGVSIDKNEVSIEFRKRIFMDSITMGRTFKKTPKGIVVHHDELMLSKKMQGKGLAKQLLRNSFAEYKKMGVIKVETWANIEVGCYAWAKYGFKPDAKSWTSVRKQVRLAVSYENVQFATPKQRDAVKDILASDDPKSIWKLSDLTFPVKVKGYPFGSEWKLMPAGKALLMKADDGWEGTIDLADRDSMRRFNNYVGK